MKGAHVCRGTYNVSNIALWLKKWLLKFFFQFPSEMDHFSTFSRCIVKQASRTNCKQGNIHLMISLEHVVATLDCFWDIPCYNFLGSLNLCSVPLRGKSLLGMNRKITPRLTTRKIFKQCEFIDNFIRNDIYIFKLHFMLEV